MISIQPHKDKSEETELCKHLNIKDKKWICALSNINCIGKKFCLTTGTYIMNKEVKTLCRNYIQL